MFTVMKKPKTPNTVWDADNNRPFCKFDKKGMLKTNDEALAEKLRAMGHVVTGSVDIIQDETVETQTFDSETTPKTDKSVEPKEDSGRDTATSVLYR